MTELPSNDYISQINQNGSGLNIPQIVNAIVDAEITPVRAPVVKQQEQVEASISGMAELKASAELTNKNSIRVLSHKEYEKISKEGFTFLTFLLNAKILNPTEFEVILDQIMILNQKYINIDEMRWIVMMTLWKSGKENSYLFVEDSLFHNKRTQLH